MKYQQIKDGTRHNMKHNVYFRKYLIGKEDIVQRTIRLGAKTCTSILIHLIGINYIMPKGK